MDSLKKILKDTGEYSYKNEKLLFVVVKPGFNNLIKTVVEAVEGMGDWEVKRLKTKRLLLSEAKKLYAKHKKEDWFPALCKYMSDDASTGILFSMKGQTSTNDFKDMDKLKDEIRNKYGESDMRNVIHSSDSFKDLTREASVYFNTL